MRTVMECCVVEEVKLMKFFLSFAKKADNSKFYKKKCLQNFISEGDPLHLS